MIMHDALNEHSGTCGDEGERIEESAAPPRVSTHSHAALLLASAAKLSARLPVFSTEDLAVAAHHLFPSAFALQGFPEHPDHAKVRVRVCGVAGLVGQGYFAREKGGLRLTAEGLAVAQSLPVADAAEAPAPPRRKRIVRRLRRVRLKKLHVRRTVAKGGTSLAMQKRIAIERVLAETGYNMRRAAQLLDVSRSNLYRLAGTYGIDVDRERRKARGIVVESASAVLPPSPPPPPPPAPPPATVPAPARPIDRGPLTDREARVVYAISRTDAAQRYLRGETERLTQEDADGFWGVAEGFDPTMLTALLERARTHYDRRLPAVVVVRKLSDLHTQLVVCRFRWNLRRAGGA